jgi:hypothetical protein
MFGKTGSVWSRQANAETRNKARAITEVAGSSGILRDVDTLAQYAAGGGRILVDDLHFRFVDGNFAVLGRNPRDFTHILGEESVLALRDDSPDTVGAPIPTPIAASDAVFLEAIADAASVLPSGSDWYLLPMPLGVSPIIIESTTGDMLVAGIDFSAHRGFIATRLSPAHNFPPGLVRIVSAYLDLPQPHSFLLSAPVGRRCSKFLTAYAKQSQSLAAFRRAAAEFCGMFVFPEPDAVLGSYSIPGATVYLMASAGALRIDYPHRALELGEVVQAGTVVAPRLELLTESESAPVSIIDRAIDAGMLVSMDGVLPVKGLYAPSQSKILLDCGPTDPRSGKPHVRVHFAGAPGATSALWNLQRVHELETGEFLYDQFFIGSERSKLLPLGGLLANYYGTQLAVLMYDGLRPEMEALLLQFVREHKPAGCVMLTAAKDPAVEILRLTAVMAEEIDSRLVGKSAASDIALFADYYTPVYDAFGPRNVNAWCADIPDITCISPRNSHEGYARGGTLLAPDIAVIANHFPIPNGATMDFYTMDNVRVRRTITAQIHITGTDLLILKLDSDVGAGINFAKVFSKSIYPQLVTAVNAGARIPVISLDQQEHAAVSDISYLSTQASFAYPTDAKRLEFYEGTFVYDSGNPSFFVYNGQLVIITTWWTGGGGSPGGGPSVHYYRDQIDAAMTTMGSPYKLTDIELISPAW